MAKGIIARLFGSNSGAGSASSAKNRLSVLVHTDGNSELTRELEERLRQTIHNFFEEKKLLDEVSIEDVSHILNDEGLMEVQIPLPDDKK